MEATPDSAPTFLFAQHKESNVFEIDYARDLKWTNKEHTTFTCMVKFFGVGEEYPFGCTLTDSQPHTKILWERALAGEFGPIEEFVDPSPFEGSADTTFPSGEISVSIL